MCLSRRQCRTAKHVRPHLLPRLPCFLCQSSHLGHLPSCLLTAGREQRVLRCKAQLARNGAALINSRKGWRALTADAVMTAVKVASWLYHGQFTATQCVRYAIKRHATLKQLTGGSCRRFAASDQAAFAEGSGKEAAKYTDASLRCSLCALWSFQHVLDVQLRRVSGMLDPQPLHLPLYAPAGALCWICRASRIWRRMRQPGRLSVQLRARASQIQRQFREMALLPGLLQRSMSTGRRQGTRRQTLPWLLPCPLQCRW